MNTVQPIRDRSKLAELKKLLRENSYRDYMLFVLGINVGMRVGDILRLRVCNVQGVHIAISEEKTGKNRLFLISPQLRQELDAYIKEKLPDDLLFPGRYLDRPLTRQQAYNILSNAAGKLGLEMIGTHTMRKTFGYWHYKTHKDVALLQTIFNHASSSVTLRYIGIAQDEIDQSVSQMFL